MSKLGAICEKLRLQPPQSSPKHEEPDDPHFHLPDTVPPPPTQETVRVNKRKNFRPSNIWLSHQPANLNLENAPESPATSSVVDPVVSPKSESQTVIPPVNNALKARDRDWLQQQQRSPSANNLPDAYGSLQTFISESPRSSTSRNEDVQTAKTFYPPLYSHPLSSTAKMFCESPRPSTSRMESQSPGSDVEDYGDEEFNESQSSDYRGQATLPLRKNRKMNFLLKQDGQQERRSWSSNATREEMQQQGEGDGWKWNGVRNSIRSLDIWQYVRQYHNDESCQSAECRTMGIKEHFHCLSCPNKVIFRKEEMIRHVKWHKKRDETLQLGFLRFSGSDDCSQQFANCPHAGRQTHYHCCVPTCLKVYTSTSDVQMHANLHRKENAIKREGFRRYRGVDDCGDEKCPFRDQKSTHFHCIRPECNFTFRNKADIEKHKAYHAKNDELAKDGFRKYMKYEHCNFENCPYSKIMNHIHCIRQGCRYVFTSSAQLHAHKRKHDKIDVPLSLAFSPSATKVTPNSPQFSPMPFAPSKSQPDSDDDDSLPNISQNGFSSDDEEEETRGREAVKTKLWEAAKHQEAKDLSEKHGPQSARFSQQEAPRARNGGVDSPLTPNLKPEVNSFADNRGAFGINTLNGINPYAAALQLGLAQAQSSRGPPQAFDYQAALLASLQSVNAFAGNPSALMPSSSPFYPPYKRKRGRPPKNPVIDVQIYNQPNPNAQRGSSQAMFSSFKLGKGGVLMDVRQEAAPMHRASNNGNGHSSQWEGTSVSPTTSSSARDERSPVDPVRSLSENVSRTTRCDYNWCTYQGKEHCHCSHPRCHFASEREDILALHLREFHSNIDILDGYEFFDQAVDCGLPGCPSNKLTRHFHCVRPGCFYSFVRYDTMATHEEKHRFSAASSPRTSSMAEEHYSFPREAFGSRFLSPPAVEERNDLSDNRSESSGSSIRNGNGHKRSHSPSPSFASSHAKLTSQLFGNRMMPSTSSQYQPAYSEDASRSSDNLNDDANDSGNDGVFQQEPPKKKLKFSNVAFLPNGKINGQAAAQPAPEGFQRYLCTESCEWEGCTLSRKQTHWHCLEEHCRQFFSDKTRLMRHAERHRRLSAIIGDDFRRYSAKVACEDEHCPLRNASHVHCLKCPFTCTETAKISTHRRGHSKQSAVSSAGFEKFSFRNPCGMNSCLYYTQTHYHCRTCSVVVNTMSQMQMHQYRHESGFRELSEARGS